MPTEREDRHHRHHSRCKSGESQRRHRRRPTHAIDAGFRPVYGEFLRTFTFAPEAPPTAPGIPIVPVGGNVVTPDPAVRPKGVRYESDPVFGEGLHVPRGVYRVTYVLNPGGPANLALLVNGQEPLSRARYAYTARTIEADSNLLVIDALIDARARDHNVITVKNKGPTLITLRTVPGNQNGIIGLLTQVIIVRIA